MDGLKERDRAYELARALSDNPWADNAVRQTAGVLIKQWEKEDAAGAQQSGGLMFISDVIEAMLGVSHFCSRSLFPLVNRTLNSYGYMANVIGLDEGGRVDDRVHFSIQKKKEA